LLQATSPEGALEGACGVAITAIPQKYLPYFQLFTKTADPQHPTPQVTLNLETISLEEKQGKLSHPE
jgi:hypothetical protein